MRTARWYAVLPVAAGAAIFAATGNTARPTGCEFNSRACSG